MKIVIVDDEWLEIKQFEMECEGLKGVGIAATFTDPWRAYEYLKSAVEVVFTDIEIPEMNSLAFRERTAGIVSRPFLVFVTGYEKYTKRRASP